MKEIKIDEIMLNPFTTLKNEWCLIGAKTEKGFNAMTASWGGMGVIWRKNVITVYIRPQRYTKEFVDASGKFTVAFFGDNYREELGVYGAVSGRDKNKEEETGFHVVDDNDYAYHQEASLVFECKSIYRSKISPNNMLDLSFDEHYAKKDYHYVYIGEIEKVLSK